MHIRRRYNRWQIDRPAKIRLADAQECADCTIRDISFKGAEISLQAKLPLDKFLKLDIMLSDDAVLNVEAWVVWHKGSEGANSYGLYFTNVKDQDKDKIYRFVYNNYPQLIRKQMWDGMDQKKGGEDMDDRRIFERFAVSFPVNFINLNSGGEGLAQSEDISAKGAGFTAAQELRPKTPLEMWLQIPDNAEPLYARGEVAWSKMAGQDKYRIGVNLEKADLMGLSRILRVA